MARILFNKAIKYNGIKYPAHTIVNINEIDIEAIMKDLGGHLFVEPKQEIKEEEKQEKKK